MDGAHSTLRVPAPWHLFLQCSEHACEIIPPVLLWWLRGSPVWLLTPSTWLCQARHHYIIGHWHGFCQVLPLLTVSLLLLRTVVTCQVLFLWCTEAFRVSQLCSLQRVCIKCLHSISYGNLSEITGSGFDCSTLSLLTVPPAHGRPISV